MDGVRLACIYSFGCPEIDTLESSTVLSFINDPRKRKNERDMVRDLLEKLDPFLFYRLIAGVVGKRSVFDRSVVRAHWLGDSGLKPIDPSDIRLIKGTINLHQAARIARLMDAKPHHNFAVLQVISEAIRSRAGFSPGFLIDTVDCLVLPAKVIAADEKITASSLRLVIKEGTFSLSCEHKEVERGFVGDVSPGDYISLHLGIGRQKITKEQAMDLLALTREAVDFFNQKRAD